MNDIDPSQEVDHIPLEGKRIDMTIRIRDLAFVLANSRNTPDVHHWVNYTPRLTVKDETNNPTLERDWQIRFQSNGDANCYPEGQPRLRYSIDP